jgi:Ala-tRNA(Pro) deacylase
MGATEVREQLEARGIAVEALPHEPTHSALAEAARLGVPAEDVVKTIVLVTSGGPTLAVIPASRRLDMALVHRATGDRRARLATEEELARDFPDCELGAFPPVGICDRVLVDPEVLRRDEIVFAAGTADLSLRATPSTLFADATVAPLSADEDPKDWGFRR